MKMLYRKFVSARYLKYILHSTTKHQIPITRLEH